MPENGANHSGLYDNWVSWVESKIFCITQMRLNWTRLNTKSKPMSHLSLSLHFNGHFPGEPGLAGVYWSKGWWRWCWQLDYWSYKSCKTPVKSSLPTNQHPVFLQAGCPSCRPTNSVKALSLTCIVTYTFSAHTELQYHANALYQLWQYITDTVASASSLIYVFKQRLKLHLFCFSFPRLSPSTTFLRSLQCLLPLRPL